MTRHTFLLSAFTLQNLAGLSRVLPTGSSRLNKQTSLGCLHTQAFGAWRKPITALPACCQAAAGVLCGFPIKAQISGKHDLYLHSGNGQTEPVFNILPLPLLLPEAQ